MYPLQGQSQVEPGDGAGFHIASFQLDCAHLWAWGLCLAGNTRTAGLACLVSCACMPAVHGSYGRECPSTGAGGS